MPTGVFSHGSQKCLSAIDQKEDIMKRNTRISRMTWDEDSKGLCFGILSLLFFSIAFVSSFSIVSKAMTGIVSASFVPKIVCGLGAALSIGLVITKGVAYYRRIAKEKASSQEGVTSKEKSQWGMVAISIVLVFLYLIFVDKLGIILCTFLYCAIQIMLLSKNHSLKSIVTTIAISVGTALVLYLPFRYIFSVMLPMGVFR